MHVRLVGRAGKWRLRYKQVLSIFCERQRSVSGQGGAPSLPGDWIGYRGVLFWRPDESTNLWRIACLARNRQGEGSAQKLTSGTSEETKPSVFQDGGSSLPVSTTRSTSGA